MSSRLGFRFLNNSKFAFRNGSSPFRRQGFQGQRFQSSDATGSAGTQHQSTFQRMWNSPIGLKTVHFWAPVMKWAIVIAGISDFGRPAEKLSLTQNVALMCTGAIWTRWCFVIKPRNILLAAVNFFLGCVGVIQVSRIFLYRRSLKDGSPEAVKDIAEDSKESTETVASVITSKVEATVKS
jgi:hypothetical protein